MAETLIVSEEYQGERFDKTLSAYLPDYSRSFIQKMIKEGNATVNGRIVKSGQTIAEGDCIVFDLPQNIIPEILAEDIPLDILYEDEDVIVVNKPKGMVVHPAPGHYTGTLVNALMYHCGDSLSGINGVLRPGIVHRIDRDTTGSIIACKNDYAHNHLALQLQEHSINRIYHAICLGYPGDQITIDANIARSVNDRKKMQAGVQGGKTAITHVSVIDRYRDYTYIKCKLETGRTHQIRVHMAHIHHPLLGDSVYSGAKWPYNLDGQCLHAETLGFIHPRTEEYIEIHAPLPDYFSHLLDIMAK